MPDLKDRLEDVTFTEVSESAERAAVTDGYW
jgi:hypothetical protein